MKQPTQSVIDDARRHADEVVARARGILTKDGAAKYAPEHVAWEAELSLAHGQLEAITKAFNNAQARGRLDKWLDRVGPFDDSTTTRDVLLEIVAITLERGELPPKPLCEYAAKALRQVIKENVGGSLLYRDTCIAGLLIDLESWGFPLFPNRSPTSSRPRPEQTYGCNIVVNAFKKAGIHLSVGTVEQVWKVWSRRWAQHRHPFCT
jgi:hypothetical protein